MVEYSLSIERVQDFYLFLHILSFDFVVLQITHLLLVRPEKVIEEKNRKGKISKAIFPIDS
jgi:hypothetical protein